LSVTLNPLQFYLLLLAGKLQAAVATPGGEQALVSLLHALSQLSVPAPADILTEALAQLQAVVDRLSAVQISGAMAALKKLNMDPDDQLMGSYLERAAAAAAAGTATARDTAAVLQSLEAAGVVPSAEWLAGFLAAVKPQLAAADSQTLAGICHAAAALTAAGQAGSSSQGGVSNSYSPDPKFVAELTAVAISRLGSNYMDASRILNTPDYKAPLNLSGLADAAWGLVQLGAKPKDLQPLISMLISKSYDRFSQLNVQQLGGVAYAIARCSSSGNAAAVKLPGKWLNQFAAAAAPGVQQLSKPQLSELIWSLGKLYLSADGQYSTGSGSSSSSSSSSSRSEGSSSSSSSSSTNSATAGSSIGRSSDVPVQQLLRAVASQLNAQLLDPQQQQQQQGPGQSEVSTMVNLLTKFDCSASRPLLQRFCADVAGAWDQLSDAAVADAAVAVAVLVGAGSSSSSSIVPEDWMQSLADQVHSR
jgi:putative intracellular protease/amidase